MLLAYNLLLKCSSHHLILQNMASSFILPFLRVTQSQDQHLLPLSIFCASWVLWLVSLQVLQEDYPGVPPLSYSKQLTPVRLIIEYVALRVIADSRNLIVHLGYHHSKPAVNQNGD